MGNQFAGLGATSRREFHSYGFYLFFEAGSLKVKNIQKSHFRDKTRVAQNKVGLPGKVESDPGSVEMLICSAI